MVARLSRLSQYEADTSEPEANPVHTGALVTGLALPDGVTGRKTALIIPADFAHDEWKALGSKLATFEGVLSWALGDWWAFGSHKYGERKAAVTAKATFPFTFGTLMTYGTVARRIATSIRIEVLSFSHHAMVETLEREQQQKRLARGEGGKWTVGAMRNEVEEHRRQRL